MKAKLEFDLPEEDAEFRCALNGGRYLSRMQEFHEALRQKLKHLPKDEARCISGLEMAQKMWFEALDGVELWE